MLLELAAANAAFAVIKTSLQNGSEIAACGAKLGEFFVLKAEIAKKASSAKITEVVFDRGGFRYQGIIAALADAAREGGLKF